ncbi:MAG: hypothetical protein WC975_10325 [Phycisphaerae bacterium]
MNYRPLFPFNQPVADFFKSRGWFQTEKLLSSWYMLSNDHVSVLIDTVKPKIVNIFVHGRYGTLRALLYDTSWEEAFSHWLFGILPTYQRAGTHYFPLKFGARISEPEAVEFDPVAKRVTLKGLHFFTGHTNLDPIESAISVAGYEQEIECREDSGARADWTIQLLDDGLEMAMSWPKDVQNSRWLTFWHPLFTHTDDLKVIDYKSNAVLKDRDTVTFVDDQGRMPRLRIESKGSELRIHPRSEAALRGAFRLPIEIAPSAKDSMRILLAPNPVTLDINPHIDADCPQPITIFSQGRPTLEADATARQLDLTETKRGTWTGAITVADGEHFITVRTEEGICVRRIFAHGDMREKIRKVGEAYLKLQYKEGPLAGLFPYVYLVDTLEPVLKWWGANEGACLSYGIRIVWLLAGLYECLDDSRFAEALFKKLQAHYDHCHHYEDGSVMPPPDLQPDGKMIPGSEEWPRPSNQLEAVMAYTMAYRSFKRHGNQERALKCLEWAAGYAKTLIHMQRSDGGLHERYRFGTFTPCHEKVFPMPQSLGMTEYIQALEEEKVSFLGMSPQRLRQFIADQLRYSRSLPAHDFKMLSGGEGAGNGVAWFVAFAEGRMLTQYVAPNDIRDDDKVAMDCAKLSVYLCALYPDYPQFYMIQGAVILAQQTSSPLSMRVGTITEWGPRLMAKGNMDDFQTASLGLALLRHHGDDAGLLLVRYALASRLATAILPSGVVCECEIDVPGFRLRQTEYSLADVDSATIGITLFHYATGIPMAY